MFYLLELNAFPTINQLYTVERKTVWQIIDKNNILIFIKDGGCAITCGGEEFILKKGDIFFIPANQSYTRRPIDNSMCTMLYIHFSIPAAIAQVNTAELIKTVENTRKKFDNEILNGISTLSSHSTLYLQNKLSVINFDELLEQANNINLFSSRRQLMCGLQSSISLCQILTNLSQNTLEYISSNITLKDDTYISPNLKKAIRYISLHYTEKISLDDLAAHCYISKQQLIRYFKASLKTTPGNYITDYKIARAKELLFSQTHLTVKEVASELGFDDPHYFSRVFMKTTGESPSGYRYRVLHYSDSSKVILNDSDLHNAYDSNIKKS